MSDSVESRWSHLPSNLLHSISKLLDTRADTLRLRSVCAAWRSYIPPFKPTYPPLPPTLPFPISPNPHLHRLRRGHFSLSDSTVYLLQPLTTYKSTISKAWLIRIEDGKNGKFRPLNPLSRTLSEHVPKSFPKVLNLLNFRVTEIGKGFSLEFVETSKKNVGRKFEELKSILVKKAVVSSSPWTVSGDDYAIMAIHAGKLVFIKLGDEKWTLFDDPKQCDDIVYHKGCFYAVDYKGRTVVIGADLKAKEIAAPMPGRGGGQFKHLVKSGGDLYLVDKYMDPEHQMCFNEFLGDFSFEEINPEVQVHVKVFKLNEKEKEWEWVDSLGGDVFFVGDDCSYSVSARDFDGLKGDCVYFCDDEFQSDDLGELCTDIDTKWLVSRQERKLAKKLFIAFVRFGLVVYIYTAKPYLALLLATTRYTSWNT
ncbi:hypothetical protein RJ640_028636 [Escallonia rubra]|uniref:KIB1-4 beta-propeller domain-containing protein n=1 Tax=Escallonia rubra TaxID=112253 RepID=A0AA88RG28_9ASTE|nr:hypothetical protein RJ640_028636 [Escallonia rubra]